MIERMKEEYRLPIKQGKGKESDMGKVISNGEFRKRT